MKPNRKSQADQTRLAMAEVAYWPDRRLQELGALVRQFQQRGMGREAACIEAYRQMIEAERLPRRSRA